MPPGLAHALIGAAIAAPLTLAFGPAAGIAWPAIAATAVSFAIAALRHGQT